MTSEKDSSAKVVDFSTLLFPLLQGMMTGMLKSLSLSKAPGKGRNTGKGKRPRVRGGPADT